jgi:hypothetical protein
MSTVDILKLEARKLTNGPGRIHKTYFSVVQTHSLINIFHLSQVNWFPDRDLNPWHPEHEAEMLTATIADLN